MQNFLPLLLLALAFAGCDNAEQYRSAIEDLSTRWDQTTTALQSISAEVQGEKAKAEAMYGEMRIPEGVDVAPATAAAADSLREHVSQQVDELNNFQQSITAYQARWQESTEQMQRLRDGLERGKLRKEVTTQISSLEQVTSRARTQIDEWSNLLDGIISSYTGAFDEFMKTIARPVKAPPPG